MQPARRTLSGRWLVISMIGFGLLLTGGMYAYWTLHTAPFQPIMQALAARYPGSAPRVDGGKPRLDRAGEKVLRIVMKSEFDPAASSQVADSLAREVATFVADTSDLSGYDVVEVHLFHGQPEELVSQRGMRISVAKLKSSRTGDDREGRRDDE